MQISLLTLIGVRLLALYLIVDAISQAGTQSALIYYSSDGFSDLDFIALIQFLLPIMIGIGVLMMSKRITAWIIPKNDHVETATPDDYTKLQSALVALLGIFILAYEIPYLFFSGYMAFIAEPLVYNGMKLGSDPNAPGRLISGIVQIGIGYYLTFHSTQLIEYINNRSKD